MVSSIKFENDRTQSRAHVTFRHDEAGEDPNVVISGDMSERILTMLPDCGIKAQGNDAVLAHSTAFTIMVPALLVGDAIKDKGFLAAWPKLETMDEAFGKLLDGGLGDEPTTLAGWLAKVDEAYRNDPANFTTQTT